MSDSVESGSSSDSGVNLTLISPTHTGTGLICLLDDDPAIKALRELHDGFPVGRPISA